MKKRLQNSILGMGVLLLSFFLMLTVSGRGQQRYSLAAGALDHFVVTGTGDLSFSDSAQTLPTASYGMQTVVLHNRLYVLGGANMAQVYSAPLTMNNEQTIIGQFTVAGVALPFNPYYFHAAGTDGTRLYLFGGSTGVSLNRVFFATPGLDGMISTWTETEATPALPYIQNHSALFHNGQFYILGGTDQVTGQAKKSVYRGTVNINGSISSWDRETFDMPTAVFDHASVVVGDRLYSIGGASENGKTSTVASVALGADGHETSAWRTEFALPKGISKHTAVALGNILYVIGGEDAQGIAQKTVYYSDIASDGRVGQWKTASATLDAGTTYASSVAYNGGVLVSGGLQQGQASPRILYGASYLTNHLVDDVFPIAALPISTDGAVDGSYAADTYLSLLPDHYITPDRMSSGVFVFGSGRTTVHIPHAGSNLRIVASGGGHSGQSSVFSVENQAPTITGVTPSEGYNNADRQITITGTNFFSENGLLPFVQLASFPLTNAVLLSSTDLRVTVPAGMAPGTYTIKVTNPDGKYAVLDAAYRVLDAASSGVIRINYDDSATNSRFVLVTITGIQPPNASITSMRFSNDGSSFGNWIPYATLQSWTLADGLDGGRNVYVQFKDSLNYESGVFSDSILYDSKAPIVDYDNVRQLPDSPRSQPTITGIVTDETSGIEYVYYEVWKTDGFQLLGEQPVISGQAPHSYPYFTFTVPVILGPGMYRVHVYAKDYANNIGHNVANPMVFTVTGSSGSTRNTGSITGVATNMGQGIAGLTVKVYSALSQANVVRVTNTTSAIPGMYMADFLPTGLYKVSFTGGLLGNQEVFYGDTISFASARVVEVTAPYNADNINLELTKILGQTPTATRTATPTATGIVTNIPTYTSTAVGTMIPTYTPGSGTSIPTYTPYGYTPVATNTPTLLPSRKGIVINNDELSTANSAVMLALYPPEGRTWTEMLLSNDNTNFSTHPFAYTYPNWIVEHGTVGTKSVYVIFRDGTGYETRVFSDTISYTGNTTMTPSATKTGTVVANVNTFKAEFFANSLLEGEPVLVREDSSINYAWGLQSPLYPEFTWLRDFFSARWTGNFVFTEGYYTFTTVTDDGVRLWVDGDVIVDKWQLQPASAYTTLVHLTDGLHRIKMEYYEYADVATAKLGWRKAETTLPNQFEAQYYNNAHLLGDPVLERIDPNINFDWQYTSPVAPQDSMHENEFSARWSGVSTFERSAEYSFKAICDDGCRVWIDNDLLINEWRAQKSTTFEAIKNISAGEHRIVMEYQEYSGIAVAKLSWQQR